MQSLIAIYNRFIELLNALSPVLLLVIRLAMAMVFWKSGAHALHDWEGTVFLFANEFNVPVLPPVLAAASATFFQVVCSVMIAFGLATRLALLPLLAITNVIYFTYDHSMEPLYWMMLMGAVLVAGPGKLSLDYWLTRKFKPEIHI